IVALHHSARDELTLGIAIARGDDDANARPVESLDRRRMLSRAVRRPADPRRRYVRSAPCEGHLTLCRYRHQDGLITHLTDHDVRDLEGRRHCVGRHRLEDRDLPAPPAPSAVLYPASVLEVVPASAVSEHEEI